jgi:DNA-binding NarL/FixJ family response regulator
MAAEPDDRIRVVVVDDHAVVRRGLFDFLGGEPDLEVVGDAAGGQQALELLARLDSEGSRPDVVLMDLQMEPVDGIQTTREIRTRFEDVEVVVLTSFGEEARVFRALEAGASGYLLKDADADEVAVAVRAAHRGELQLDPAVARRLTASLRADSNDAAEELTSRERDVLGLLASGETNKGIAASLGIGERTARTHVSHILSKLGLTSRTQAALWAAREGIADADADPKTRAGDQL